MYEIKINEEQLAKLNESDEPKINVGRWIICLFWFESGVICALCTAFWTDCIMDNVFFKEVSKSKARTGFERLLCCWILVIKDWKLEFDNDRYIQLNDLWCKVDDEKYKNYIWMWTMEQVMEYEKMLKFVRKLVK